MEDFKRALARVQSDYGFFVDCQVNPAVALAGYDLTTEERLALTDAEKLAEALTKGLNKLIITFSGKHDWVNRTKPKPKSMAAETAEADRRAKLIGAARAVKRARTDEARTRAAVTMIELME